MTWLIGRCVVLPLIVVLLPLGTSCASSKVIPGTRIRDEPRNREVINIVEDYRRALEGRKISKLLAMAHPHYYEHSGTPTGSDDYGYRGLLKVVRKRMKQVMAVRCNLKYMRIHWPAKNQVEVEVYVSASFQLKTEEGERWHRMTDYNKFVLVKDKDRWLFIGGM
jgi:hypothetical protein